MRNNPKKTVLYWLLVAAVGMGIPALTWAAPTCNVEVQDPGPPRIVTFTFQESQVGLKVITVKDYRNARITMQGFVPPFQDPVVVTVTQINANLEFYAVIEATDMNNEITICQYPSPEPPRCSVINEDPGPPFMVSIAVEAPDGLASITVDQAVNAEVDIPNFPVGTTDPVIVTAQKIDEFADLEITLIATDVNQDQNTCFYSQAAQSDTEDPEISLTAVDPGPPTLLEITARDSKSGLGAINIIEADNADVQIPPFAVGTTDPVVITATQNTTTQGFRVEIEVVDRAGNNSTFSYGVADRQTRPEVDLAGDDAEYFFRDAWIDQILHNGRDASGKRINDFSAFETEYFNTTAGQASLDNCYSLPTRSYFSVLTPTWTEAEYEWEIVLQMEPATDLVLKLRSCVLKTGENDVWAVAYESGYYTLPWAPNEPVFVNTVNPRVSVLALPGPMAKDGFPPEGLILDTRRHAGLQVAPLSDSLITVQALAGESVVIALPVEGDINASGQTMYALRPGDRIKVRIFIPDNTPSDLRFGADGAMVQYIGLKGTEYLTSP